MRMGGEDRDPATIIGWTITTLALAIAVLLPLGYFSLKYSALGSAEKIVTVGPSYKLSY